MDDRTGEIRNFESGFAPGDPSGPPAGGWIMLEKGSEFKINGRTYRILAVDMATNHVIATANPSEWFTGLRPGMKFKFKGHPCVITHVGHETYSLRFKSQKFTSPFRPKE